MAAFSHATKVLTLAICWYAMEWNSSSHITNFRADPVQFGGVRSSLPNGCRRTSKWEKYLASEPNMLPYVHCSGLVASDSRCCETRESTRRLFANGFLDLTGCQPPRSYFFMKALNSHVSEDYMLDVMQPPARSDSRLYVA